MDTSNKTSVAVATAVTAVAVALGLYMMWQKIQKARYSHPPLKDVAIPTNWQKVGEVAKVIIYPLKSAVEICVDKATCTERGLKEVESDKFSLLDR